MTPTEAEMRAVGLFGDGIGTADLPRAEPCHGEVLVRVSAAGVTPTELL